MGAKKRLPLDAASLAWARLLAIALKRWLKEHGYQTGFAFADEVRISRPNWSHIAAGNALALAENYAKIFLRTHLPEADPCTLPLRRRNVPGRGAMEESRAWTIKQYQNWLSKQKPAPALKPSAVANATPEGQGLEKLLAEMQQLRMEVSLLRQLLQPATGSLDELAMLVQKVVAYMNVAVSGTAVERDRFFARYGPMIASLLPLADALSEKRQAEREKKAARIREFGEVQL